MGILVPGIKRLSLHKTMIMTKVSLLPGSIYTASMLPLIITQQGWENLVPVKSTDPTVRF